MKNNCFGIIVFLVLTSLNVWGQNKIQFVSPVNHPIVLAGSFGEIRSTHFHAGLDIKPSGKYSKDSIFSSEMGYISRIKINRSGYGKALYINHPSGYTTVYAHLSELSPQLETYVRKMQRAAESYEIDVYPNPGEVLMESREYLGIMGNTGRSYGTHLHFEIRDTRTEEPLNPMLFGIGPEDTIPPTINGITINSLSKEYQILDRSLYPYRGIPKRIKVKGWRAGIGLSGFDQMNFASNKNGIYQKALYVDDTLYYQHTLDRVSFYEMNQIKAHIDYEKKILDKSTYALMYATPANSLMIIDSIVRDGVFPVYASKARKIKIVCKDFNGNETLILTEIIRDTTPINLLESDYNLLAEYKIENSITADNITLSIPKGALEKNEKLVIKQDTVGERVKYLIGKKQIPLLLNAKLSIKDLASQDESDKLLLVQLDEGKYTDYGTLYKNGVISSYIGSFGEYQIIFDTIPPYLKRLSTSSYSTDEIIIEAYDNIETKGSATNFTYDVYVNGNWTPCEYKSLVKNIYISKANLKKGDIILVVAEDQLDNRSELEFIY